MACLQGHADAVRALLGHAGVDANRATTENGCTPLWIACSNGHADVVRALIEAAGASLVCLPPYSPDLDPIEMVFGKM